jgi:hypothetical protein
MREDELPQSHVDTTGICRIGVAETAILGSIGNGMAIGAFIMAGHVLVVSRHALSDIMTCLAFDIAFPEMTLVTEIYVGFGFLVGREYQRHDHVKNNRNHR